MLKMYAVISDSSNLVLSPMSISIGSVPSGIDFSFTSAYRTTDGYEGSKDSVHFLISSLALSFSSLLYKFHTVPELIMYLAFITLPSSSLP